MLLVSYAEVIETLLNKAIGNFGVLAKQAGHSAVSRTQSASGFPQ